MCSWSWLSKGSSPPHRAGIPGVFCDIPGAFADYRLQISCHSCTWRQEAGLCVTLSSGMGTELFPSPAGRRLWELWNSSSLTHRSLLCTAQAMLGATVLGDTLSATRTQRHLLLHCCDILHLGPERKFLTCLGCICWNLLPREFCTSKKWISTSGKEVSLPRPGNVSGYFLFYSLQPALCAQAFLHLFH